jgi:hypothetical protein
VNIEQYANTLAVWLGVTAAERPYVFPLLSLSSWRSLASFRASAGPARIGEAFRMGGDRGRPAETGDYARAGAPQGEDARTTGTAAV